MTKIQESGKHSERDFDLVVLGATGLTGRLVVEQLAQRDTLLGLDTARRRWAIAGRDDDRLAKVLTDLQLDGVETCNADLADQGSLLRLAERTAVVLSCAGPYTSQAEGLIDACVQAGTSYVDLSGEIPLLRRVIDRFDEPARLAGVQIVQMAGWEAMPADLTTLVASRRAASPLAGDGDKGLPDVGPGAATPIASVLVAVRFLRVPAGGVPLKESISAGTMASIVEMLKDPNSRLVGQTGGLLHRTSALSSVRSPVPLNLRTMVQARRVFGPVVPVAFLNPPIVYRTASILAGERKALASLATYREGVDLGSAAGLGGIRRKFAAACKGILQRLLIGATRLPFPVRKGLAKVIEKLLPAPGSGPSGRYLTDWRWEVEATATAKGGRTATALLAGSGHPGYTATASIIAEVALHMASRNPSESRSGCLTPALVMGLDLEEQQMRMPSLRLR